MSKIKLKIGLMVDSLAVEAWVYHAIERVFSSDYIEISLVILNGNAEKISTGPINGNNKRKTSVIYKTLNSMDKKIFIRGSNALEIKRLDELLIGIPILRVSPVLDGAFETISLNDIEQVRNAQLDILVKLGFKNLSGDILSSATYGVWAYHFGDQTQVEYNYVGYWEVIKKSSITTATLYELNLEDRPGRILYQSSIATFMFSPARNKNSILWFASAFLVRQLEILSRFGIDYYKAQTACFINPEKIIGNRSIKTPSTLEALKSGFLLSWRILQEVFVRLLRKDYWYLLFDIRDTPSLEIKNFRKLIPPPDRFWADPFTAQENKKYYIFVEEFFYKKKKGIISVLELDAQGGFQESIPVLEKDFHLSYPCVFKSNGTYYMIPESSANKSIDLFQCESFPSKWDYRMTLMGNLIAVDSTMFFYNDKWWLFTGLRETADIFPNVELFLFYSDTLFTTEWKSHPLNPVVSDVSNARPAGQIFIRNNKIYRPSQNCTNIYGNSFNLNEIICLSETEYTEKKVTSVQPDWDSKVQATHTYNQTGELSVIDAYYRKLKLS